MKNNIEKLRKEVDVLDGRLVLLLNKRNTLVKEIMKIKSENNLNIKDKSRERYIIDRLMRISNDKKLVMDIYKIIFDHSVKGCR